MTSTVIVYSNISFFRFKSRGRLLKEPVFTLGRGGRLLARTAITAAEHRPISRKLACQPKYCPTIRPSGIPATIAITVPVLSRPKA